MNANELADLLADTQDPDVRRAVAMLRQQKSKMSSSSYDDGKNVVNQLFNETNVQQDRCVEQY